MKELRCLVFTESELVKAIVDRRRRVGAPVPVGTVRKVTIVSGPPVVTTLHIFDDHGIAYPVVAEEAEVAAALVKFCMDRKVPMPVKSDKFLHVINGAITLMMTMNFEHSPRAGIRQGASMPTGRKALPPAS